VARGSDELADLGGWGASVSPSSSLSSIEEVFKERGTTPCLRINGSWSVIAVRMEVRSLVRW